jgi:hypothetical protein
VSEQGTAQRSHRGKRTWAASALALAARRWSCAHNIMIRAAAVTEIHLRFPSILSRSFPQRVTQQRAAELVRRRRVHDTGKVLSRGGCQNRWQSLINCDHGDSITTGRHARTKWDL